MSPYRLMKATGLSSGTVYGLVNDASTGLSTETLEKICVALQVTPNDVIEIELPAVVGG